MLVTASLTTGSVHACPECPDQTGRKSRRTARELPSKGIPFYSIKEIPFYSPEGRAGVRLGQNVGQVAVRCTPATDTGRRRYTEIVCRRIPVWVWRVALLPRDHTCSYTVGTEKQQSCCHHIPHAAAGLAENSRGPLDFIGVVDHARVGRGGVCRGRSGC